MPPMSRRSFAFCSLLLSASLGAQQTPPRDPRAVAALQQAVTAMGAHVPADSVASGTVVLVAGGRTDSGTIGILTRGPNQTREEVQTADSHRVVIHSRGHADEREGASVKPLSMELAATSQSPDFPLPLLAGALNSPETALQYLGPETLDGSAVHHIRFWTTFSSQPKLRHLAEFSQRDLWLDVASGLPRKLAHERRAAGGSAGRIAVAVFYSDYRNVGGVLYPFMIKKSFNGTPWATISIQNVALNTGLTEADFPIQ